MCYQFTRASLPHQTPNLLRQYNESLILQKTKQSTRYAENPRDMAVFREWRPSGSLFRKNKKKTVFRHGLKECMYQILGLYRLLFGQEA